MLFFMGAASHLGITIAPDANLKLLTIILGVIIGLLEVNAIRGKTGPITTIKGVITWGFVLTAILYLVIEALT